MDVQEVLGEVALLGKLLATTFDDALERFLLGVGAKVVHEVVSLEVCLLAYFSFLLEFTNEDGFLSVRVGVRELVDSELFCSGNNPWQLFVTFAYQFSWEDPVNEPNHADISRDLDSCFLVRYFMEWALAHFTFSHIFRPRLSFRFFRGDK